ncbi:MAG: competence/damage-inducible protein A [Oscillospiraceae bacterium]|jgi:nicotinamide-nucleotide amidase|nr:competence/damage-inducible protein A [Oscillospiraceae bacterium]
MKLCEIINVGTELLLGEILNTDAQILCGRLAALGISVQRAVTVGDNPGRLREDFLRALGRSDIVILTGGLGPTKDDLTKEAVAEALGLPLVEDAAQMAKIEGFFRRRGLPLVESNRKQALVPAGCTVLYNENGTAPGCFLRQGDKAVALLPGPPRELLPMLERGLLPLLEPFGSGAIVSHYVRTVRLGESRMAELAGGLLDMENPTVAPYAKEGEAYLRVSAHGETRQAAEALCAPVIKKLENLLGNSVYAVDKELAGAVLDLLSAGGKTLALAESCTGGGIAARLTDVPGASKAFLCSFVTYSNEAKVAMLGVSPETLSRYGAVSAECAREMALGARQRSGADIAASVTGIAGPGNEGTDKPAGLIYLAATDGARVLGEKLETGRADRGYNRVAAAKSALALVRDLLC